MSVSFIGIRAQMSLLYDFHDAFMTPSGFYRFCRPTVLLFRATGSLCASQKTLLLFVNKDDLQSDGPEVHSADSSEGSRMSSWLLLLLESLS